MINPERFFDTKGLPLASLTKLGILQTACNLVKGEVPTRQAAWEKRLAKDVSHLLRMKIPTRNLSLICKNIYMILAADDSVADSLSDKEWLVFAVTVRRLQQKRQKSLYDYNRRHHFQEVPQALQDQALPSWVASQNNFLLVPSESPLPPGTRLMTEKDYQTDREQRREDQKYYHPLLDKLWQAFGALRRVVPAVFVIPSIVSVSAVLASYSQPEPTIASTPLLRDQARVQPTPDFAKTAPAEVIKAHQIAQSTIADLPPEPEVAEILFRLLDEATGKPLEGTVEFDGQSAQTNEAGLIHMKGNTLRSFGTPLKSEVLKITLMNGRIVYVTKEIGPGFGSTLLRPEDGKIRIDLKG